jgi:amino acid adenylation domain-containing protein
MSTFLSDSERHQLLVEWNNTQINYPQNKCLHHLFEAQVERTPDAIAIVFEDARLTYQELNQRANQLAHYLKKLGVEPEILVGVYIERSLEMVIGLLGILKAGGAYVPIDPTYPTERISFMLEDAQTPILLTQANLLHALSEQKAHKICLDSDWQSISQENENNLNSGVKPDNLAYVIYTSGSTGKPKGVMNTHLGICNRLLWMQDAYHLTDIDSVLQKTPFSFDVSVWEFFWPLLVGARLVVAQPGGHQDPDYLLQIIIEQKITTLHFVPSMLQVFVEVAELENCTSLQRVICSGEVLPFELQKRFFARSQARLHNLYGPTEAAVDVTYWECKRDTHLNKIPIGRPIANTQIYILDDFLQPVSIGTPGELHIGGVGLARGYLNRPELTTEKFIPNPFNNNPKTRLYKTGDLARYLPDGNIEYLGRIDKQVKIRGFRIELGEIEFTLNQNTIVHEVVVIAREDENAHKRLIAYIVPKQGNKKIDITQLRQFLQEKLPDYMVPSAFIVLDAMPLTPNGKIDYQALPAPDNFASQMSDNVEEQHTQREEILLKIVADVLDLKQISINDNIFDLGGDSILLIQVIAQAKKAGFSFSIQQFFQHKTIAELAALNTQTEFELGYLPTPKVDTFSLISEADRLKLPDDVEDAYPVNALQAGMIFQSLSNPDRPIYHDVFRYQVKAPFDPQALQQAIQHIINRHPVLRTSFSLTEFEQPLQLIHKSVRVPLTINDFCHLSSTEQEEFALDWIEADKKQGFNLSHSPLLRFQIYRCTFESFHLLMSVPHAIMDGWSVASMITEFFQHYLLLLGQPVPPLRPPPTLAFRDFIALEKLTIKSAEHQQYWLEKAKNLTFLKLPRWPTSYRVSKPGQTGVVEIPLSTEIFQGLKQLASQLSVPLKSVVLAAHIKVLSVLGHQTDIVTGLVSNGRIEETDGERVLGLFLNTIPFRLQLTGGSWIELVQQIVNVEHELLPYRRFPLAEIHRRWGVNTQQPLFETAFNFVDFHVYQSIRGIEGVNISGELFFEENDVLFFTQFRVNPLKKEVKLKFNYDAGELCEKQIKSIGDYYLNVLSAMGNEPRARYENHSVLSKSEQQKILVDWNNTTKEYPQDQCIHHLFEAQVERTPDAVAIVFENKQLSYRELNQRANQLAHYLIHLGVKPETLVGICTERSLEMLIGILGILKAGGAYVPLDPTYPHERLAFMLEDAKIPILLSQSSLIEQLPSHNIQIICLDTDWKIDFQLNYENKNTAVQQKNLAYVIYTSGSTGNPKGVAIEHHSAVVFLAWAKKVFSSKEIAGVLASTSICFDLSIFELFVPLSWGGKIILVKNALYLSTLPSCLEVTLLNTVPSAMSELVRINSIPASVQVVNLAGEPIHKSLVEKIYQQETIKKIYNLYGPSEDTTYSTFALIPKNNKEQSPYIGCPIANTQVYLLDENKQPVPIGVSGELYIGGEGLARGYLNRPELTAEKFIPNPFNKDPKARLYKTGDLARYLPDGNIEYLGRIDNQVKIRGFRIELGEIETILNQDSRIQEAVVIVHEDEANNKRLIAYIVNNHKLSTKALPSSAFLREILREKLPDYMIPASFVFLKRLPLTPNGKVNRKALPQSEGEAVELKSAYLAPETEIEQKIARILQTLLHVKQIGIHDNFFDLGGNSLLLVQVQEKLLDLLNQEVPILTLFQYPTISRLRHYLEKKSPSEQIAIKKSYERAYKAKAALHQFHKHYKP